MVLFGTLVNVVLIIIGSVLGLILTNIKDSLKNAVIKGIGLVIVLLGIQMGLESKQILFVIISIVIGIILGEIGNLDEKFNNVGQWFERKMHNKGDNLSQGFITASLLFVIGAMAVVGAMDSGIRNDHQILITKGIIDGITAIFLTATLGIGVIFSAIPVFFYQGIIALFASQIDRIIPESMMGVFVTELTATGGIMILAIGLNMLGITNIKVANMLPGLLVVMILVPAAFFFSLI